MSTFVCVLIFVAVGALVGFIGSRIFKGTSLLIDIVLGLVGSFGISWLVSLLGLGGGFLTFTVWGLVFGILGAFLLVAIYGFIQGRKG